MLLDRGSEPAAPLPRRLLSLLSFSLNLPLATNPGLVQVCIPPRPPVIFSFPCMASFISSHPMWNFLELAFKQKKMDKASIQYVGRHNWVSKRMDESKVITIDIKRVVIWGRRK